MTVVAVSPHLDDAVLSVGGTLARLAREGERVVVLTVFSEGDASYAARRAEDVEACASLGLIAQHLGLADAPYRRDLPRTFEALVHGPLEPSDADALAVSRALVAALAPHRPRLVLWPLGVGEHVDHRIVHGASAAFGRPSALYEDRPYANVRHAVAARLFRLGLFDDSCPQPGAQARQELVRSGLAAPHVEAYLPAGERRASLDRLAAPLEAGPGAGARALSSSRVELDAGELAQLAEAIDAYRSQVVALLGAPAKEALRAAARPYRETLRWPGAASDLTRPRSAE